MSEVSVKCRFPFIPFPVLREPPFLDLVVLILIGFNYFSSVSASGRGVIGHVTKGSLNKEGTIEQSACVRVTELAAS